MDTTMGNDATEYGGRYSGFDPQSPFYTPSSSQLPSLADSLFADTSSYTAPTMSFDNLDTGQASADAQGQGFYGTEFGKKVRGLFAPGTTAYQWGMREPGTTSEQMFNSETPQEKGVRMDLVSNAAQSLAGMMIPSPIKAGMAMYNAYKNNGSAGDIMSAGAGGLTGNLGRAVNTGLALNNGDYGKAFATGVGGPLGNYGGMGIDASLGKDVTQPFARALGGDVGNAVAGPLGGMFGRYAANKMTQPQQQEQPMNGQWQSQTAAYMPQSREQTPQQEQGSTTMNTLGQLMGMFNNYQQGRTADQAASRMTANLPDLNSLYGPNSPAYAELRRQLEAKDAAAGRRSQYGTRETELAARMAALQGQHAASFAKANMDAQESALKARQTSDGRDAMMLNNLYQIGENTGINKWLDSSLGGLFGNSKRPQPQQQPNSGFNPYQTFFYGNEA